MSDILEIDGRTFVPAVEMPIAEWATVLSDRPLSTLTLKDDDLFLITDTIGNIAGSLESGHKGSMGLFCRDTRFLSRLDLQIEGKSPILLSSTAQKGFILSVLCANPQIDDRIKAETIGIHREIVVNGGLFEEIHLTNYSISPLAFSVSISFDADFMDLFEVRGYWREKRGRLLRYLPPEAFSKTEFSEQVRQLVPQEIVLAYQGLDGALMESRIQFSDLEPSFLKGYTAVWELNLEPHQTQTLGYKLHLLANNRPASAVNAPVTLMQAKAAELLEEQHWSEQITQIRTNNKALNQVIERAEHDIYLLRQTFKQGKALSAGVPWFSTLFGRDSIIAASQTLILDPAIARETLAILAYYQGKTDDDWREEEPGKILHEMRFGEMARCNEVPHTPYYGTIDATPLWLMLYAEYFAWTYDRDTRDNLWPNALAAMDWIDRNCQATGYLSYDRRSRRGLVNQGWKDSGDCIVDRQGHIATGPITLAEVQGYVYAAKLRLSEIARMKKMDALADQWQAQAADLKERFNRDFWLPDQHYCALALDENGKRVDSITSNPGQCLHLGILDDDKAHSVAERLRAPDMFNGWGIRTLSSLSPAYNPMGYHTGSVWPHDNGLIGLGLRSLGLVEQSLELAQGLFDMTSEQPYQRPPELFCGYERFQNSGPVQYPVACTPQAWSSGTIFQLVLMMTNLVPDASGNCLRIIDPALLPSIDRLCIYNLKVGQTLLDLEFERSAATTACRVINKRGNLRVMIEA